MQILRKAAAEGPPIVTQFYSSQTFSKLAVARSVRRK
jgi:hypothetical protein